MLKKRHTSLWMHFFFISLFLIVPSLAFVRPPGEPAFAITRVFLQDTTANFVLLCFFYLNYYILLPKFYFHKKYMLYACCVIAFLAIALTLPYIVGSSFHNKGMSKPSFAGPPFHGIDGPSHQDEPPGLEDFTIVSFVFDVFRRHLSLFFTAIFFSFLLKMRERLSKLKEEKLEAELTSLKAQINPHFLFNTLNSIYVLSVKKDERAGDAIVHLSGLMRYVIKDAHDYKIPVQKELEYIFNYIELQKARLGNTASIHFECSGDATNKEITPLILITYIENAFKYGVNPNEEDCSIDITIQVTDKAICLRTFNRKVQNGTDADSTGIGMENTEERLNHLYPKKYTLNIVEDEQTYLLTLEMVLV